MMKILRRHIDFTGGKNVWLSGIFGDVRMRPLFTGWNSKSVFDGPTFAPDSISKRTGVNAKFFRPLCKCLGLSIKKQDNVLSSIIVLSRNICPATVILKVSFASINSIKTMAMGPFTHISIKSFKCFPFFTDSDAALNVISVHFRTFFSSTSILHRTPRNISGCSILSVTILKLCLDFLSMASARTSIAVKQVLHSDNNFFSAFATTIPHGVRTHIGSATQNGKAFDVLTRKVIKSWHDVSYILGCGKSVIYFTSCLVKV